MCGSRPKLPPPPPPAAPPVNPAPPAPVPNILQSAEDVKRSDSSASALSVLRGRSSLRIDRAVGTFGGGGGNGLNIPN